MGDKKVAHGTALDEERFDESSIKLIDFAAKKGHEKSGSLDIQKSSINPNLARSTVSSNSFIYVAPLQIPTQNMPQSQFSSYSYIYPHGSYGMHNTNGHSRVQQLSMRPLPPISPNSPHLAEDKRKALNFGQDKMKDGIPEELHPLPDTIPIYFARIIFSEIKSIVQTEDLRTLTKKNIRSHIERNLKEEKSNWETIKDDDYSRNNADLRKLFTARVNLSLEDADRKKWISRAIVYLLKRLG
jgi:hypothetical protein